MDGWMPHGHCYFWEPWPLYSAIVGSIGTAVAYYTLGVGLLMVARRRWKDHWVWVPSMAYLFGTFIFLCGTGHIIDLVTIWYPIYNVQGAVRLAVASWSLYAAWVLVRRWPEIRKWTCE